MSASGFKDTGPRSWLSNLKTEGGCLGGLCSLQLAVPCAAYKVGWRALWEMQSRHAPSFRGRDFSAGKSSEWPREGGLVQVPAIPLTSQKVKRPSTPEFNEIKINSQHSVSLCFPPFGNFAYVMFIVVVS